MRTEDLSMRFTLFPYLTAQPGQNTNPYIRDFIDALQRQNGISIANPPHKNPLLSLIPPKRWGDVFVFNWFESIPDFKYGMLQSVIATVFLYIVTACGRQVVWMLHNKRPHDHGHTRMKRFLSRLMARRCSLIVTHATEGVELIKREYPYAADKVHFLHHPTKNRLPSATAACKPEYDLLIWGQITPYKGILEFLHFLKDTPEHGTRVHVVGGASDEMWEKVQAVHAPGVTLVRHSPSFDELASYIARAHFVLIPYNPDSVLSSGILMDSLSFGAKVIGPCVGSFRDYTANPDLNVYTFHRFSEILSIVRKRKAETVSYRKYRHFLEENDWPHFARSLVGILAET